MRTEARVEIRSNFAVVYVSTSLNLSPTAKRRLSRWLSRVPPNCSTEDYMTRELATLLERHIAEALGEMIKRGTP